MPLILFVCSGNTCRSPMAQALARRYFVPLDEEKVQIRSAGLAAAAGAPATPEAVEIVGEMGGDLSDHASRSVEDALMAEADLVLTMTRAHRDEIRRRHPGEADKVYRLADFSGLEDHGDVADPFGGSLEQYRRAYFELEEHILAAVPRLRDYLHGRDAKETRN